LEAEVKWLIGDVHGEAVALYSLVAKVLKRDPAAKLYFVGDFVDRGPDSYNVVEFILQLGATCVRGNHDDIFDLTANGNSISSGADTLSAAKQTLHFMNFGMAGTLHSYSVTEQLLNRLADAYEAFLRPYREEYEGEDPKITALERTLEEIRVYIPQTHKDFFRNLPSSYEEEDFFMIHAFRSLTDSPIIEMSSDDLLWGRFESYHIHADKGWKKTGYFGHTPTRYYGSPKSPVIGNSLVLLDTGVTFRGCLTAFCHETKEIISVDKAGELNGND
jgi:serine/threonine protein phosphatase 1